MRVLVTGIAGFVGRHLARSLRSRGDVIFGLDRPGTSPPARVAFCAADIRDSEAVSRAVAELRPDAIYHLAGFSSPSAAWDRRREVLEVNLLGASSVLEAARRQEPRPRVLLVGSAHEYGRGSEPGHPLVETTSLEPTSPYGVSKAMQEMLGRQYALGEEVPVILVRAFNHSGPGQPPDYVIPEWARRIAEIEAGKRPARLEVGDLEVVRDFSDVRDIVRLYRLLVTKGRPGEAYNACSGVGRSLAELVECFRGLARVEFEVVRRRDARPADMAVLVGSCDKARREVGWQRRVPFERTVAAVLDDWRRRV